jgi:hypothetical protein
MMRMLHLFLGTELQAIYAIREQRYRERIANYTVAELSSASLDDMVAALVDMCKIEIPILHDDRVERSEMPGEVPLYYVRPDPMNIDRQGTTQGIIHTIHVPYTGPQEAFYYKPPIYPLQMPAVCFGAGPGPRSESNYHADFHPEIRGMVGSQSAPIGTPNRFEIHQQRQRDSRTADGVPVRCLITSRMPKWHFQLGMGPSCKVLASPQLHLTQ